MKALKKIYLHNLTKFVYIFLISAININTNKAIPQLGTYDKTEFWEDWVFKPVWRTSTRGQFHQLFGAKSKCVGRHCLVLKMPFNFTNKIVPNFAKYTQQEVMPNYYDLCFSLCNGKVNISLLVQKLLI